MPDLSGQSIGRYHIIEQLGQGGMAVVYKAYDTRLECDVAVKCIRMERLTEELKEKTLKRFEREAKEVARLTHPNIVKVMDYGEYQGIPYLVMPYLPGGTLKQRSGEKLPWREAVCLVLPVARALAYAHSHNIIHRDIKPGNILITDTGEPMLSDFGVAKILDVEDGNTLTGAGVGVGTPEYMAPEQWMNKVVPQTDIYALGVVLYELVTGRKPYSADTPAAVLIMQSSQPLPRPQQYVPDLPEGVEKVLYKAMAKEPKDRYASMGEFAAALEGLLDGRQKEKVVEAAEGTVPIVSDVPPLKQAAKQQENETIDEKLTPPEPDRTGRENGQKGKGWIVGAAGGVILLGILCLVAFMSPLNKIISPPTKMATSTLVLSTDITTSASILPTKTATKTAIPPTETAAPTLTPTLGVGSTRVSEKDGMLLMYVPSGTFEMGSENGKSNEKPVHTVYLDAYWIDQTEVTNGMYAQCVSSGDCTLPHQISSNSRSEYYGIKQYDDYPVIYVDWNQADAYCRWTGRRLPSEAEWEKAARGTDERAFPWGEENDYCHKANYAGCMADSNKTGSYPAGVSPYGALDMAGNVWEWVVDWYDLNYYANYSHENPTGPDSGEFRVIRGGAWYSSGENVRSSSRGFGDPDNGGQNIGFRCAVSP